MDDVALDRKPIGSPRTFLRRARRSIGGVIGAAIVLAFISMALLAPLISPYEPDMQSLSEAFAPMSADHLLGTDHLGQDIFSRIIYGGRITLTIGVLGVSFAIAIGVPLGLLSGFFGGWVDLILQRFTDILLAFNPFLLALLLVAVFGVGMWSVIIAAGVGVVPQFIRLVRGQALAIRELQYVEAARSFGSGAVRIMWLHVLRNSVTPIIVFATLNIGLVILTAAGLGFLGLGVQPPTAEWGTMLGDGRAYIFHAPAVSTFPGLAIFAVVLGFNLAGDALRDWLDPSLKD